jgi:hypothetical protein
MGKPISCPLNGAAAHVSCDTDRDPLQNGPPHSLKETANAQDRNILIYRLLNHFTTTPLTAAVVGNCFGGFLPRTCLALEKTF